MSLEHPRGASWDEVRRQDHLWLPLRDDETLAQLHWHSHGLRSTSSQVFCINAFWGLARLAVCDDVLNQVFAQAFPATARPAGKWKVEVEKEDRTLLGEGGRQQPTSVDAFCATSSAVVCIESKFDRDGRDGFGSCSQLAATKRRPAQCRGFYGPESDVAHTHAWCRLEDWDNSRGPRLYWALAKSYFETGVFEQQSQGGECPFGNSNFQLMRNFLFAATHARKHHLADFGVLVICPEKRKDNLEGQIQAFRKLLLHDFQDHIALVTYEDYISTLRASGDEAQPLARFLATRINDEIQD